VKNLFLICIVSIFQLAQTVTVAAPLILPAVQTGVSDSIPKPTFFHTIGNDIMKALDDGVDIVTAPARFGTKDWLVTGGVLGGTGLAFFADKNVRAMMLRNRRDAYGDLSAFGNAYGYGAYAAAAGGCLYFGGLIADNAGVRETGAMTLEALAYAGLITTITKVVFGRSRPYVDEGPSRFRWFQVDDKYLALPSGHCTVAFALSTVLARQIDYLPATILLYGFAGVTFLHRMYEDRHWFSDTVLGSAIGYFVADAVVDLNRKHKAVGEQSSILVYPVLSAQGSGMGLAVGF
jgi:membrane-associated phospholipid phosphatase